MSIGHTPVARARPLTLGGACRDEVEAGLEYRFGSEVRRRRVEPYRLVVSGHRW